MEIKIKSNRSVSRLTKIAGVQGEQNAETLAFTFPEQVAGLDTANLNKYIQFNLDGTTKIDLIQDNQYSLSDELTSLSEIEAQVLIKYENTLLFKSNKFTLTFNESLDNSDINITFDDLDIFNTLLDKLKEDSTNIISEIENLKDDYSELNESLESKIAEVNELSNTLELVLNNANLQVSNVELLVEETNKLQNEIETALSEYDTKTDEKVSEFISTYNSKIEELNTLATNLTNNITSEANSLKTEFDENAEAKTTTFNSNVETKTNEFNENAETKLDEYNSNNTAKIEAYNKNHEAKMKLYNDNDVTKTNVFNSNAEEKTTEFNNNVTEQTNTFNQNVTTKKAEINTLAETKITEYNENTEVKLNEFNENAESYEKRIAELETENSELVAQMPWKTTEMQESIHVEDSAKYSRNKLSLFGNLKQETREGYNLLDTSAQVDKITNGITKKNNKNGTITLTGTTTNEYRIALRTGTLEEGKYTYKCFGNSADCKTNIYYVGDVAGENTRVFTVNAESTLNYDFVYIIPAGITINVTIRPILVKGEYTADTFPSFEQYGAMPSIDYPSMPVVATGVQKIKKIGKNLCDGINQNYYLHNNAKICGFNIGNNGLIINVEKGQNYTISTLVIQERYRVACLNDIPLNSTGVTAYKGKNQDNTDNSITIDTTGYKYLVVNATDLNSIFIEQGDTATTYEPYTEEVFELDLGTTELCKIVDTEGNVVAQDRFVFKDDKWQIERNINKSVFVDGTGFATNGSNEKTTNYLTPVINIEGNLNINNQNVISNLVPRTTGFDKTLFNGTTSTSKLRLNIENKYLEGTTIDGLLRSLNENGTPLTIYNKAKTVTYEDCTAEQSEVLDKLYKLQLEKGTNNIIVESENGVTAELQLEYMQDLMSQINELKQAMLNIGGN